MTTFRGAHQVFKAWQIREAGHGGEHALMGMRAIREEAVEQQTFFSQLVEIWRDIQRTAQSTNEVTSKALDKNHHHILNWQGVLGRRSEITANGSGVGID